MDPYRAPPGLKTAPSSSSSSVLVVLVVVGFVVLGTDAPVGKDFLLWGFTVMLAIVIAYLWQRGEAQRGPLD